jgi:hypothetical protein
MEEIRRLASFVRLRPYASYMARLMGYELVGAGGQNFKLADYRFFTRKIPYVNQDESDDPYIRPFTVDIHSITSRVGFSYAEDGWHPFVQTLQEYLENPRLKFEDSTLKKLYDNFQPKNVQEVLLDHISLPLKPICDWPAHNLLIRWIWALNRNSVQIYLDRLHKKGSKDGWIFFGPHSEEYGKREFSRLIHVFESIKRSGYQKDEAIKDPVNGYFLKSGNDVRFVLLQGNHRISALKVLGYSDVDVVIRQGHPAVVDRADLRKWTCEGGGIYPSGMAGDLFDSLFYEKGIKKAQRYGLRS